MLAFVLTQNMAYLCRNWIITWFCKKNAICSRNWRRPLKKVIMALTPEGIIFATNCDRAVKQSDHDLRVTDTTT
jgi:hypothetical protein